MSIAMRANYCRTFGAGMRTRLEVCTGSRIGASASLTRAISNRSRYSPLAMITAAPSSVCHSGVTDQTKEVDHDHPGHARVFERRHARRRRVFERFGDAPLPDGAGNRNSANQEVVLAVNGLPAWRHEQRQERCADRQHAGHPEHHRLGGIGAPDDLHENRRKRVTQRATPTLQGGADPACDFGRENEKHAREANDDRHPLRAIARVRPA